MQTTANPIDTTGLLAEEALYLGAAFAHIAAHNEHHRLRRIEQQNRMALRSHERRTGFIEIEEENEDMIDPQAIRDAAEAFILADAEYTAHGVLTEELKIEIAIAERGGDEEAIATAKAAKQATDDEWHGHYMARQDTADALVRATGVDPRKLAAAINLSGRGLSPSGDRGMPAPLEL